MHTVHKMLPIATDVKRCVDCLSLCVLVTQKCRAKMAELTEMPFEELTHVGQGTMY